MRWVRGAEVTAPGEPRSSGCIANNLPLLIATETAGDVSQTAVVHVYCEADFVQAVSGGRDGIRIALERLLHLRSSVGAIECEIHITCGCLGDEILDERYEGVVQIRCSNPRKRDGD